MPGSLSSLSTPAALASLNSAAGRLLMVLGTSLRFGFSPTRLFPFLPPPPGVPPLGFPSLPSPASTSSRRKRLFTWRCASSRNHLRLLPSLTSLPAACLVLARPLTGESPAACITELLRQMGGY